MIFILSSRLLLHVWFILTVSSSLCLFPFCPVLAGCNWDKSDGYYITGRLLQLCPVPTHLHTSISLTITLLRQPAVPCISRTGLLGAADSSLSGPTWKVNSLFSSCSETSERSVVITFPRVPQEGSLIKLNHRFSISQLRFTFFELSINTSMRRQTGQKLSENYKWDRVTAHERLKFKGKVS